MIVEPHCLHSNYCLMPITTEYLSIASVSGFMFGEILQNSLVRARVIDLAVEKVDHNVSRCLFSIPALGPLPVDWTVRYEAGDFRLKGVVVAYCFGYFEVVTGPLGHSVFTV